MADLEFSERPQLRRSIVIAAFAGWPDASEAATGAIDHLIQTLHARQLARIDPEEYFDFTQLRPDVSIGENDHRVLEWPSNRFHYWKSEAEDARDIVLLDGVEPHLRWKRFTSRVMEVADFANAELFILLGSLLDAVPHTRTPRVTPSATTRALGESLNHLDYGPSTYEGPTGVSSAITEQMADRNVPCVSIWGHAPHYLQVSSNPTLTHAILVELEPLLPLKLELSELERRAAEFSKSVERALKDEKEISGYVQRLEERFDSEITHVEERPDSQAVIRDLEEFLKSRRPDGGGGDPP